MVAHNTWAHCLPADASLLGRIRERICDTGVAHLITWGAEGYPRARGMEDENVGSDFVFYFFTGASSRKIAEIRADPRVAIAYYEPGSRDYICVFGQAEVITDDALRSSFWRDEWKRYWPAGPTDPEYVVVRILGEALEYFDMEKERLSLVAIPRDD
jgi:general stress protein 26